jgi:hypothetical protein
VKFNAADPVRLILVHWLDRRVPLDVDAWTPILNGILELYNDGDFVLDERTEVFAAAFQGEPALKWEGVWQNEKYVIGGPFRAYAFHRGDRSYVLVGRRRRHLTPARDQVRGRFPAGNIRDPVAVGHTGAMHRRDRRGLHPESCQNP